MIVPAVDILNGKCVQLEGGNPGRVLFSSDDPVEVSRFWKDRGYPLLHVIDLDAALGSGENTELIKRIKDETGLKLQVGGGIRSAERARALSFAERLIVGTMAVENPELLKQISSELGREKLILSVDSRADRVSVDGWRAETSLSPVELSLKLQGLVGRILYTAIEKEGRLGGPNIPLLKKLVQQVGIPVIYAGGISSEEDITAAEQGGAEAVVVGTYLYRREFNEKG